VKTNYVIPGVDPKLCEHREHNLTAALDTAVDDKIKRARAQFERGRSGFKPGHQPRDSEGRFRRILARLKFDLGDKELENIVTEIKAAEDNMDAGDITAAAKAGQNVVKMVDEIDQGVLDPESIRNVRNGARELGRALAYLPLPQGDQTAKVRFSDLPRTTQQLVKGMIDRVVKKIGADDAADAVANLRDLMAGGRSMSSDDLSRELNKLLRLLT
jgi:hypothetical protein